MPWLGNWLGKYLGNWLGTQGSGNGVTISAAPLLLSLFSPAATEITGVIHTATPVTISLFVPVVAVKTGNRSVATPLLLASQIISTAVITNSILPVASLTISLVLPAPLTRQAVVVTTVPLLAATDIQIPTVKCGAIADVAPIDLSISVQDVGVITGALAVADAIDIFINVVVPKVYDRTGSITYPASLTMKLNVPEIIAFSTDITTDMQVIDAMGDDMAAMDGTQSVKLLRKTDNVVISLIDGTAIPENKIYTFENALIRQIADRDNRAVKQLRLFMQSVQNDDFPTMDTIIELPMRDDVKILSGDIIQSDLQGTKYDVVAVDTCTLKTRWRVGARKFV